MAVPLMFILNAGAAYARLDGKFIEPLRIKSGKFLTGKAHRAMTRIAPERHRKRVDKFFRRVDNGLTKHAEYSRKLTSFLDQTANLTGVGSATGVLTGGLSSMSNVTKFKHLRMVVHWMKQDKFLNRSVYRVVKHRKRIKTGVRAVSAAGSIAAPLISNLKGSRAALRGSEAAMAHANTHDWSMAAEAAAASHGADVNLSETTGVHNQIASRVKGYGAGRGITAPSSVDKAYLDYVGREFGYEIDPEQLDPAPEPSPQLRNARTAAMPPAYGQSHSSERSPAHIAV